MFWRHLVNKPIVYMQKSFGNFRKITACVLLLGVFSESVFADAIAERLQQKLNKIKTMQASFKQVITAKNADDASSYGKMALVKPKHFRWQTIKPMPQLFIADGKKVWMYDEELEQVSVRPQAQNLRGAAAIFLGDGSQSIGNDFAVKMQKQSEHDHFYLKAKGERSSFSRVELIFSGDNLQTIDLFDELGQHTHVTFSQVQLNLDLPSNLFKFTVPKGTDVVQQ